MHPVGHPFKKMPERGRACPIPCSGDGSGPAAVDLVVVSSAALKLRDMGEREDARRYRTLIEQLPLVVYVDALDGVSFSAVLSAA